MGQFAEVTYDGGTTNTGPAIRISNASGRFSFYGLVALYVPAQQVVVLVRYNGEPLSGFGISTGAISRTLLSGDILRIEAEEDDQTLYRVKVNGSPVLSAFISDPVLNTANACIGMVTIATVPEDIIPPVGEEETVVIVKSSDQSKVNDIAIAEDSELKIAVGGNETWVIQANIQVTADSAVPDINFTFDGPAGSVGFFVEHFAVFDRFNLGVTVFNGIPAGLADHLVVSAICVNGATPGNFSFRWAQATSSGDATTVKANSFIVANKKP